MIRALLKSGKKQVSTMEGDIDYETVVCDSCGEEHAKQNSQVYITGNVQDVKDWGMLGKTEYKFDRDCYEGWLCPHCQEPDGLVGLKVAPRLFITLGGMVTPFVVAGIVAFLFLLLLL